jgi:pyruvyl transferase EpsO
VPLIRGKSDHICIIDPPGHPNVGDCAIFLGELAFLRRTFPKARISFFDVNNYSSGADKLIDEASLLLIHGGGNFGDIWPVHHGFRKLILSKFPHKTIIQLPQSIHFDDVAERNKTADLIGKAQSFTLMARDRVSENFARSHFPCSVTLCPDMAFAMEPIHREPGSIDILCLLRVDKESILKRDDVAREMSNRGYSVMLDDWLGGGRSIVERVDNKLRLFTKRAPSLAAPFRSVAVQIRRAYAFKRLAYGVEKLSQAEVIITDRLHVHVLCCLLGIRHVIYDSYDGKVSALHDTWTREFSGSTMARSPMELCESAANILKQSGK